MGTGNPDACSLTDFKFLANGHVETCPAGHEPRLRNKKNGRYSQGFDASLCQSCPLAASCPAQKGSGNFYLRYTAKAMRLARRRQYKQTQAFREKYRWRAGAEATMSQYDRLTGVKHLRVRGFKAVRFAAVMKAIAVNLVRAVAAKRARKRAQGPNPGYHSGVQTCFFIIKERISFF